MPGWVQIALAVLQIAPQEIALILKLLQSLHPQTQAATMAELQAAVNREHAKNGGLKDLKDTVDKLDV